VALEGARDYGAEVQLFDLRELNLPMFVPGADPIPAAARELCDAVFAAQGMLWSSPLYHGTVSGAFKNALDWFQLLSDRNPPYLTDKVVGLISTAGGTHGLQAVNTMEFAVRALRGWAVPLVLPIPQAWQVFKDGRVVDARVEQQLRALGHELARAAQLFGGGGALTTAEGSTVENQVEPLR
jgi:FMN reductase